MSAREAGSSFAIVNATLVTMAPLASRQPASGPITDDDLGVVAGGAVVVERGAVAAAGSASDCREALQAARKHSQAFEEVDAGGRVVTPGFIDAHTHALFAGSRVADFEAIAAGRRPMLGIRYTVELTRRCSRAELAAIGADRLALMLRHGTTTAEVKSGYGLTLESETAILEALADLDARPDLPQVVATFCGAHALPPEFDDYDAFVDELCERMLPAVAGLGIARFADAFCERGYFSTEQSRRFLEAGKRCALAPRVHADELSAGGGARLAADVRAASADHLNFMLDENAGALAAAKTTAVLCPATTEYLGISRWAPARALLDAGVVVALATDFNPGTSPCCSLQTVAHLARRRLGMSLAEVLAGLTVQPARSLGILDQAGHLQPGRRADILVWDLTDLREIGYYYGVNAVQRSFLGG